MKEWNDIIHRQIFHSSDELVDVTAQPRKVNLKNENYVCQLRSVIIKTLLWVKQY